MQSPLSDFLGDIRHSRASTPFAGTLIAHRLGCGAARLAVIQSRVADAGSAYRGVNAFQACPVERPAEHKSDLLPRGASLLFGPSFPLRLGDLLPGNSTELAGLRTAHAVLSLAALVEVESRARTFLRRAISSSMAARILSVVTDPKTSGARSPSLPFGEGSIIRSKNRWVPAIGKDYSSHDGKVLEDFQPTRRHLWLACFSPTLTKGVRRWTQNKTSRLGGGTVAIDGISQRIDDTCRIQDMIWERMQGGPLEKLGVERENIEAFLWPSLIATAFWTGFPTLKPIQAIGVLIGLFFFFVLVRANRRCKSAHGDLGTQMVLLTGLGSIIFFFGHNEAGTDSLVYRHVLIPIVLITGLTLVRRLFGPLQDESQYADYLSDAEMFQVRGTRLQLASKTLIRLFFSLSNVLLRPMQLLLPSTAATLLAPPAYVHPIALVVFVVTVVILLITASDDRLDRSFALLVRRFSRNAALVVSLAATIRRSSLRPSSAPRAPGLEFG
jgi:hypothetical protein